MPLADAFVSNDAAVKLITAGVMPSRDLGGVDVKSIDVVKLGQLYAMLAGKNFIQLLPEFAEVHSVSDDGPWIWRCPAPLQSLLAGFSESEVSSTARRWAQTREFALDRVDSRGVALLLRSLSGLARLAESNADHLYLWNCL